MAKIYVASSWRNVLQPEVVTQLRLAGHQVYDFRNPSPMVSGFSWSEVDPNWKEWTPEQYINALSHERSIEGYKLDHDGIMWADVCVLVLPSGRSAHVEAGYMKGLGKQVYVVLNGSHEAELMYKVFDRLCLDIAELLGLLPANCTGSCGMNYCDDNGCVERKRNIVSGDQEVSHD